MNAHLCRYPMDIVVCSALGADMFDSVFPTRTGRFGVALVPTGSLKLKNSAFAEDMRCALTTPGIMASSVAPVMRLLLHTR